MVERLIRPSDVINRQEFSNDAVTIGAGITQLAQVGTMSAACAATVPLANSVAAGFTIEIVDESGTVTSTNKITLTRSGSNTINGATSIDGVTTARGVCYLVSDGSTKWFLARPQNHSDRLTEIAALSPADGKIIKGNGTGWVSVDADPLSLTVASTPTAEANKVKVFAASVGGKTALAWVDDDGVINHIQNHLGKTVVAFWQANGNGTTISSTRGNALTFTGTATSANVSTNNRFDRHKRLDYAIVTPATTAVAGWRQTSAQHYIGGTAAGEGGFLFIQRWAPATPNNLSTIRVFAGMSANTAAPTDVDPDSISNIVGLSWKGSDTNMQIVHRGASAVTRIDLGASFPRPTNNREKVYELTLYSPPGTTQEVYYQVEDITSGAIATGLITTNLPTNTTLLTPHTYMSVGGTSSVIAVTFMSLYTETLH